MSGTAATGSYKLELDPPKRNVFVTQLNDREEEDETQIHAYPIVKESAGKLIETGLNTLQKTLLLKKEVEVERVDEELLQKRKEFSQRMEECTQRQVEIQKKQQKMRDRVTKFEKFIKENDAKRRRAIQKYQTEVKLKEQKNIEYQMACMQLEELVNKHSRLKNKLARYKRYEEYLLRVVDILPAHYLEVNDSMLNSLMMRHRTLSDTNMTLVENLTSMADNLEDLKQELDHTKQDHDKKKLSINSQLSHKKKAQEHELDRNQEEEQIFTQNKVKLRQHRSEFGQILMAIDNIAEKCLRKLDPEMDDMDLDDKLRVIQDYIVERSDVVSKVLRNKGGNTSATSERKKSPNKRPPPKSANK